MREETQLAETALELRERSQRLDAQVARLLAEPAPDAVGETAEPGGPGGRHARRDPSGRHVPRGRLGKLLGRRG